VHVDFDEGHASLKVPNLPIEDYGNVVNALKDGPSREALVSFNVNWGGGAKRIKIRNATTGFVGEFIHDSATLKWSGSNEDGFSFVSDPLKSEFAEIGRERNGVFFNHDDDDD
jgi:hypothetical protein